MSDQISQVGSANAVSSTSAASAVRLDGLAEVQYYNIKAIGVNRIMGTGGDNEVPLGAALTAYTGDASTEVGASSTRSLLEAGSAGFDAPPAETTSGGFTPVDQSPSMSVPPPSSPETQPTSGGFTPVDQAQTPAGNPYMQPPIPPTPAQAPPPPVTQPTQSANHSTASIGESSKPKPKDEDDDDFKNEPLHIASIPQNERDFALDSPLDDKPKDTWAPDANRSKEFAALDNMKLTTPEEALAQWRMQQESAARNSDMGSAPPPPTAQAPPTPVSTQQASIGTPAAPEAAPNPYMSTSPTAPVSTPTAPGNPYLAPPPAPSAPPSTSSQAMPLAPQAPAPSAPVDLSQGEYSNPNLNGPGAAPMRTMAPAMTNPMPVDQRMPVPNAPYILPGGPQGMYQNRFNAMAQQPNMNPFVDDDEEEKSDDGEDSDGDMMNPVSPSHHRNRDAGPYSYLSPNQDDVLPGMMGNTLLRRLGSYGA